MGKRKRNRKLKHKHSELVFSCAICLELKLGDRTICNKCTIEHSDKPHNGKVYRFSKSKGKYKWKELRAETKEWKTIKEMVVVSDIPIDKQQSPVKSSKNIVQFEE